MRHLMGLAACVGLVAALGHGVLVSGTTASHAAEHQISGPRAKSSAVDGSTDSRVGGRRRTPGSDPFSLLSQDSLLGFLQDLTSIRPFAGWRTSTTSGETEGFDFVEQTLSQLWYLAAHGLEVERHPFRTIKGVEFWETRVELTIDGQAHEVPADGSPGHRDRLRLALRFDSDGELNDSNRDPVVVEGRPLVVRSAAEIDALSPAAVAGRVVLLDYAVIDYSLMSINEAVTRARTLLERGPAGVVMVTEYSNRLGESHGTSVSYVNAYYWVEVSPEVPILSVRLEDLEPLGITRWSDLDDLESVRLTWDTDLFSPGESAYLMARIPGSDSSRAVILGAHIDSANTPGAVDNGSGSVTLLEVARVLDRSRFVPPTDLYLVWFGGHERGIYGSQNFANDHSELLDRTIAMLQMDCLGRPLDGMNNQITLETWTYSAFGDGRPMLPDYLDGAAAARGVATFPKPYDGWFSSDNGSFNGHDVPNANMIYLDPFDDTEAHYANHMHDPYDTVELAAEVADVFEDMARVMLIAAVDMGAEGPHLRVTPSPDRRALFVASHTETPHMSAAGLTEFGMALAWEGFDVDTVPYGTPVTDQDLADADLVIALPVHDYPSPDADVTLYDEAWTQPELDALRGYVEAGGMLVLTNSTKRLKYHNYAYEQNEDWQDQNELAGLFGVTFHTSGLIGLEALTVGSHPLRRDVVRLELADDNAVGFSTDGGEVVARIGIEPAVAVVSAGAGEVVVVGDLGILGTVGASPDNHTFWRNLARRAR